MVLMKKFLNQKIGSLSGGEKNMLQLAKISASNANMLLLDEPTSHLDTYSQMALEKAIKNYNGAILMISHDFYSIVNCMDYVLIIEDKTIRKMSMRKFRKMIYANHFDKDYLEIEQKKKSIETKIELALKDTDFELAKDLSEELEKQVKLLKVRLQKNSTIQMYFRVFYSFTICKYKEKTIIYFFIILFLFAMPL